MMPMWTGDRAGFCDFGGRASPAIRNVCRQFIVLCRKLDLFSHAIVAIDGSNSKAVNNRDKNFTNAKMQRRMGPAQPHYRFLGFRCAKPEPATSFCFLVDFGSLRIFAASDTGFFPVAIELALREGTATWLPRVITNLWIASRPSPSSSSISESRMGNSLGGMYIVVTAVALASARSARATG